MFCVSWFGSRSWAVGAVTCSKKLLLNSDGKGVKRPSNYPLCFDCSSGNGSMPSLGRVRLTGDEGPLHWEEGLIPSLILVVGTG